jgi:hypothetical protein
MRHNNINLPVLHGVSDIRRLDNMLDSYRSFSVGILQCQDSQGLNSKEPEHESYPEQVTLSEIDSSTPPSLDVLELSFVSKTKIAEVFEAWLQLIGIQNYYHLMQH